MKMPFTFAQATEICNRYQNLLGSFLDPETIGKGYIECIAVAPYEESKQWLFAQYYKETRDPVRSLRFYEGREYDIVLLATPLLRKRGIHFTDLRNYLKLHQHKIAALANVETNSLPPASSK